MDVVSLSQPTRRIPPPCWTNDQTVALIEAYRDKWYSLRRGNLRAPHWQEVADCVSVKCGSDLPKTSIQCRHKMEKLRKRYRNEQKLVDSFLSERMNKKVKRMPTPEA
ncbi:trihelix protein [Artemisia annua]|uniref:Trihelix protein n=1 Tax=Artemisia annua TaxID=35608 RepID=A0A2U1M446_ARTAN|nr:trihelix protein [Artemisia annua]